MKTTTVTLGSIFLISTFAASLANASVLENTDINLSGYIKIDAMWTDFGDGTRPASDLSRDFYIPSLTPVGGEDEDVVFDFHAKQTRFRFTSDTNLDNGDKVTGVIEFDFQVTPDGDERISNSSSLRMRHAFIKYKNWLIGQTWSTFQDVKALPDTLDFIGATDGTIFNRQPMVRYTNGAFEFALENPETTVTVPTAGGPVRVTSDDNSFPDLIARYTFDGDWGHLTVAGIARQLSYQEGDVIDSTETAFGASITSKIMFGKNDLRLMANFGSGLGRYLALNTANGAVLDADGELEAIDSYGFNVAYRIVWDDKWRSTIDYALFNADNDTDLTGLSVTEETWSTRVNLIYQVNKALSVGGEVTVAERTIETGDSGSMNRLQFSAKYAF